MNGENCILISCFNCTYYEYNYIDQILFLVIAALPGLLLSNRLIAYVPLKYCSRCCTAADNAH